MTIQQLVNDIIQQLVNLVGELAIIVIPIVITSATAWLKNAFENIKRNQPEFVQALMEKIAEFIIRGVQQEFENGTLEREELIDVALERFKLTMKQFGYKIDDTILRTLLESLILPTKVKIEAEKKLKANALKPTTDVNVVVTENLLKVDNG